ncbi:MAG: fold metallo-hydrolase [Actinomycetia bacterium]|jgi:glyoxylase-like metal-dependent hydrolase (beta-lactamase superfamily II)|nr:fold metallo-hydrolase [Actinomycetes bacterium]
MTQGQDEAALIGPAGVPRQVTARATWLLAPNPSPMTFDGTNSWVLHEPGRRGAVIVDPGPDDPGHLSALVELALDQGGRVDAILLTHGHSDHSAGLRETARRTGAPVLGASSRWCDQVIGGGPLDLGGLRVDVIPTPGHSSDSLSFHLPADESMVTGDTVLGRSAPAIMDPDGRVDQTIDSLSLIKELLADGEPLILPGHGPLVTDPRAVLAFALTAREARLAQVEEAVRDGHGTVGAIADRLYGPFDERIRRMIEATVRAHLRYLHDRRRLSRPVQIDG